MKTSIRVRSLLCGVAAAAMLAPISAARAQEKAADGSAAPTDATIEEVVVTAQKRSERLQDVPLAVSAVSAESLAAAGVNGTDGIANLVPSLTFTQNTSALNNNVRIRGIGTVLFSAGIESSVSFVVDGVVMARQGQGFSDLIDVDRVEVLRGPQGTLFGKNATAGVINIVTKRPSDHLEGSLEASAAEQGEYRLRGTVSGPLSDRVRGRLTGFYTNNRGWIYDYGRQDHVYGSEDYGLRGKLEFDATETLNLLLTADYRKSDSTCCQPLPYSTANPLLQQLRAPVVASVENRSVNSYAGSFSDVREKGVSLEANLEVGDHTITSITAWRSWDFLNNVDVDGFNTPNPVRVPFGFGYLSYNGGSVDIDQKSQELRLTSPSTGPLTYTLGLMYYRLDLDRAFRRRVGGCPGDTSIAFGQVCPNPAFQSSSAVADTSTENYAAFGQVQYHFTPEFSALGGFRLQRETTRYAGVRTSTPPFAGDAALLTPSSGRGSVSDTDLSGKVGLQYEFSRHAQIYGTWSRGYKGYGYDVEFSANFATQNPVKPETVEAWEVGFKGQALENRLTANVALFLADYSNLQVQAASLVNGQPVAIPTNAGSSKTRGFEVELGYRPTSKLSINAGLTYLHARLDGDGLPCALPDQARAVTVPAGQAPPANTCFVLGTTTVQNVRDGRLPNSPEWKGNLSVRYEDNLTSDFIGFVQVNGTYQSNVLFDLSQDPVLNQGAYGTVDVSLGVKDADGRYSLTVFVKNVGDKHYANGMLRDNMLTNAANPDNLLFFTSKDAARYIGATLRMNF